MYAYAALSCATVLGWNDDDDDAAGDAEVVAVGAHDALDGADDCRLAGGSSTGRVKLTLGRSEHPKHERTSAP